MTPRPGKIQLMRPEQRPEKAQAFEFSMAPKTFLKSLLWCSMKNLLGWCRALLRTPGRFSCLPTNTHKCVWKCAFFGIFRSWNQHLIHITYVHFSNSYFPPKIEKERALGAMESALTSTYAMTLINHLLLNSQHIFSALHFLHFLFLLCSSVPDICTSARNAWPIFWARKKMEEKRHNVAFLHASFYS